MKLSLRWVCDHLKIDWEKIDSKALVETFNTSVAEIENVHTYSLDLSDYAFGFLQKVDGQLCELFIPEWNETALLPLRTDFVEHQWYLIKRASSVRKWVTLADLHLDQENLLPPFAMTKKSASTGSWRKDAEVFDYILDVDNKSITHRPDLWSHRGFAREIAPLLKTTLRKEDAFLEPLTVQEEGTESKPTAYMPFSVKIGTPACKRFAALYCDKIAWQPSALWMALRLARIDQRPIDLIVDTTNYVMLDLGQPMHVFDADVLAKGVFGPRMAQQGEQLALLGGLDITLSRNDMVIADSKGALSLAGIKGGLGSSVTSRSHSLLLESATFDGGTVRVASVFHKIRTEGSARFEKEVDPYLNTVALKRYVKLLKNAGVPFSALPTIVSLGALPSPIEVEVSQKYIEDRLGIALEKGVVKKLLQPLGFGVIEKKVGKETIFYVQVPSYRATKDIKLREDIVEEVGRLVGYTTIPELIPLFERPAVRDGWADRLFFAKSMLAFGCHLKEVQNYSFLDNNFLKKIGWVVETPVTLANPLSEQRTTLVDSLVVNLLQNIFEAHANHDQIALFEWARIWSLVHSGSLSKVSEQKSVAGVWYKRKGTVDFYQTKGVLQDFFVGMGIPVHWKSCLKKPKWSHKYQVADLVCNDVVIGKAGKVSSLIMGKLGGGDAFAFELDAHFLVSYVSEQKVCKPLPKYQTSFLDISSKVPLSFTVEHLQNAILQADKRITHVQLQDVFYAPEWKDSKSMTFRFFVRDDSQAVSRELLEEINDKVQKTVLSYGASVR